ncbi:MAG: hypothetical protein F6K09_27435 [Merismopedia sp. SIO2A8]|nr:hypothetical protein [Merismopedia sp. SIO2A8]
MSNTLSQPSSFIHEIHLESVGALSVFKFSDHLQDRMELLLEKKKAETLTSDESTELTSIGELDRIFTHINAMMAAQYVNQ